MSIEFDEDESEAEDLELRALRAEQERDMWANASMHLERRLALAQADLAEMDKLAMELAYAALGACQALIRLGDDPSTLKRLAMAVYTADPREAPRR